MSNTTNATNLVSPGLNTSSTVQGALQVRGMPTFLPEHWPSAIAKVGASFRLVPQLANAFTHLHKCGVVLSGINWTGLRRRAGGIFMKQQNRANMSMKGANRKAKAAKITNDLRMFVPFFIALSAPD